MENTSAIIVAGGAAQGVGEGRHGGRGERGRTQACAPAIANSVASGARHKLPGDGQRRCPIWHLPVVPCSSSATCCCDLERTRIVLSNTCLARLRLLPLCLDDGWGKPRRKPHAHAHAVAVAISVAVPAITPLLPLSTILYTSSPAGLTLLFCLFTLSPSSALHFTGRLSSDNRRHYTTQFRNQDLGGPLSYGCDAPSNNANSRPLPRRQRPSPTALQEG